MTIKIPENIIQTFSGEKNHIVTNFYIGFFNEKIHIQIPKDLIENSEDVTDDSIWDKGFYENSGQYDFPDSRTETHWLQLPIDDLPKLTLTKRIFKVNYDATIPNPNHGQTTRYNLLGYSSIGTDRSITAEEKNHLFYKLLVSQTSL